MYASYRNDKGEMSIEATVCEVGDLEDGQTKAVEVNGVSVLLVKENGTFHALGAKCSHYGAPLASGSLCNGRIRCPWHGACFNIATGDIEDFPGLESLPVFEVVVKNGKVIVKADKSALEKAKRTKTMVKADPCVKKTVLIIGGGPAALVCAETLRQECFKGQIIIATKEKHLPYDRPKLSKAKNQGLERWEEDQQCFGGEGYAIDDDGGKAVGVTVDQISLRDKQFCDDHKIEFKFEYEAEKVDVECKKVTFKGGHQLCFDKLVLATGTTPRVLTMIKGHDLKNVTTLRTYDDSQFIAKESEGKDVVILGTSFIGVELAAALAGKAKSVSLADLVEAPFQHSLGKDVGNTIKKLLAEKGVQFHFQTSASEFVGSSGKIKEVILQNGTRLPADLCVMGVGVVPVTDFLKGSGINISDRGFVTVNKRMQTNKSDVYAVGDITQFPLFMVNDESINIQHWQMAHQQGRIAALNIAGKATDIRSVPFFWTVVSGKSLRYTGYGFGYDDIVFSGNLDELKFVAFYTKGDRVVAVATMNSDPLASQAADYFLSGRTLTKDEIKKDATGWTRKMSTFTHL